MQEITLLTLPNDTTNEEEETPIEAIVNSPPPLPICPRPDTSLPPHLQHDIWLMKALVAEELGAGAPSEQASELLVRFVLETTLQPGQEVL